MLTVGLVKIEEIESTLNGYNPSIRFSNHSYDMSRNIIPAVYSGTKMARMQERSCNRSIPGRAVPMLQSLQVLMALLLLLLVLHHRHRRHHLFPNSTTRRQRGELLQSRQQADRVVIVVEATWMLSSLSSIKERASRRVFGRWTKAK